MSHPRQDFSTHEHGSAGGRKHDGSIVSDKVGQQRYYAVHVRP